MFGIDKGHVTDVRSTHADIMPTLLDMLDLPIPDSVDGLSLYPHLRGEAPPVGRGDLHIEHAPNHHCLTDGHDKYIWWAGDGREQLFDLDEDPNELHDLATNPATAERTAAWRQRLIAHLTRRPEGFVRDGQLVVGQPYRALIPTASTS